MWTLRRLEARSAVPVAALVLGSLLAGSALGAPYVDVTYDLGESSGSAVVTIPLIGGVPQTLGSFRGTQTLRYASDSASNAVGGPVQLVSFHLTVNLPVYWSTSTNALKLGTATVHLEIPSGLLSAGSLSGSKIDPQGHTAVVEVWGDGHCYALCAALGSGVTMSVVVALQPTTFVRDFPTLYTRNGAATVSGWDGASFTIDPGNPSTATFAVLPVTFRMNLVGREVSRTPVGVNSRIHNPEPETLLLLGFGLAGLAAWGMRGGLSGRRARPRSR